MNSPLENDGGDGPRPNTKWVKGELHGTMSAAKYDPRAILSDQDSLHPFDGTPWFDRVARHWEGQCVPLISHAWNEGQHCWLFLAHGKKNTAVALANWYTLAFRPVFAGGASFELLRAIAQRLAKAGSVPNHISLSPVPRADGTSDLILRAFRKAGWIALRHQSSTSWTVSVTGKSFDDYWAERPGELRSTVKRKSKKAPIDIAIHLEFDEAIWSDYAAIYADSWKQPEGSMPFLHDMALHDSALGQMRLGIARVDGEPVAAQLWTVCNGVAYIHKLAHRQGHDEYSPGTLLSAAMFRHVIDEDRVDLIDFGTGNDRYKADWMDRSEPLDTIRLYKQSSFMGLGGAARAWISSIVRKVPLD